MQPGQPDRDPVTEPGKSSAARLAGMLRARSAAWEAAAAVATLIALAPLLTIAGACLLAVIGGRSNRSGRFQVYQRLRPILGAIGGFLFALLGFAIGHVIY